LDDALQPFKRLTLISAPAGYGKTSLASAWILDRKLPTAWISLDEQDNDPIRFIGYLLAALEKANPHVESPDLPAGPHTEGELQESILVPLLNQIGQSSRSTLIVLDDYHWIQSPPVHQVVGYILENLPTLAHMIIISRADPALPITLLRGRGQLLELRMEDLRFQVEEAESFLEWFSEVELTPGEVQILTQRTEGWIAGLQMAAVSLRGQADQSEFIQSFSGSHRYIMDYLLDEVLRRQSPRLQAFLLNTSILTHLCGPLCDTVLEASDIEYTSSKDVLLELEHANLFIIPLDEEREWYRYHRLFADLLQVRLLREHPERIQALHHQASQWFEEQNLMEEAIRHALQSDDIKLAADLVERASQDLLMRSETTTFLRLIQRLPTEEIASRPRLGVYQAWALLFQGAPLRVVEAVLPNGSEESDPPGGSNLLQAFIALSQGKLQEGLVLAEGALNVLDPEEIYLRDFAAFCIASAHIAAGDDEGGLRILEKISESSHNSQNPSASAIFLSELAEMRLKQMQLDEAQELYQRSLSAATGADGKRLPIAGRALIGLGNVALERYELDAAERLLSEGIELASRWSLISTLEGYLAMAMVHNARGESAKWKESIDTLYDLARRFDASDIDDLVVELMEAGFKAHQGDYQAVRDWASRRGLEVAPGQSRSSSSKGDLLFRLYKYEMAVFIRLLLAESRYEEAQDAIEQLISMAADASRPFLVLEAEILRARLLNSLSDKDACSAALRRALEMALPSQAMRLFLNEGETIIQLLRTGRSEWESPELLDFVDRLVHKASPVPSKEAKLDHNGPEALSARELEVLQLLLTPLTAEELARQLVISVNTVRSHMKSIYAKLGVHSRHQAVERARSLNLL